MSAPQPDLPGPIRDLLAAITAEATPDLDDA